MLSTLGMTVGASTVPVQVWTGSGQSSPEIPTPGTPSVSPYGLTPAQARAAYGFNSIRFDNGVVGDGTGQTVAIVVAFEQPNIKSDLAAFDKQYNLPAPPTFTVYSESGATVAPLDNWGIEASLDVEWVHAMAPGANILLVEAASAANSDLYGMVQYATGQSGVSVVSMSFGTPEFSGETSFDSYFTTPSGHTGVTFVAGAGDSAGGEYPSASPDVLSVGGTTLSTDAQGDDDGETAWPSGGGGISPYESQPSYQLGVVRQSSTRRTTPDVSFNAGTAASIYDSYDFGTAKPWSSETGTSLATPNWSALVAIGDQGSTLESQGTLDGVSMTLPELYSLDLGGVGFHDITTGSNGNPAGTGYDLATGIGTPVAQVVAAGLSANMEEPTPIAPTGVVQSTTPTFSWSAVPGATAYNLVAYDQSSNTGQYAQVLQTSVYSGQTSYTPTSSLFGPTDLCYWQVTPINGLGTPGNPSNPTTFSTASSNAPVPISPVGFQPVTSFTATATVTTTTPTLTWATAPEAAYYGVTLEMLGNPSTYIYQNLIVGGNSFPVTSPLPYDQTYLWYVEAFDFVGGIIVPGPVSSSSFFTISHVANPTAISPTDGSTVATTVPDLQWTAVPGAVAYDVSIEDTTNPGTSYSYPNLQVLGTSYEPDPDLNAGDTYHWDVVAVSSTGELSGPSILGSFTIPSNGGEVNGNLIPPTITSPVATAGSLNVSLPDVTWTAVAGATGYLLSIIKVGYSIQAIPVTGTSYQMTTPLVNGFSYEFSVRAVDGSGETSDLSQSVGGLAGAAPIQETPTGTVATDDPTFTWSAVPGASSYSFGIRDITANSSLILGIENITGTSYTPTIPLANGDYSWAIGANNSETNNNSFFIIDVPGGSAGTLASPVVSAPAGALTTNVPTFSWSSIPGATGYAFYLQDSNYLHASSVPIKVTGTSYTPTTPLIGGDSYFWWVSAFDNNGDVSPMSQELNFIAATLGSSLAAPVQIAPSGLVTTANPIYQWSAVSGASSYVLNTVDLTADASGYIDFPVSGLSYQDSNLKNGHLYEWYIAAVNSSGVIGPSSGLQFTDFTTSVAAPTPLSPVNKGSVTTKTPTLSWSAVPGASSYSLFLYDSTVTNSSSAINLATTSYTPTKLLINNHVYAWFVQADFIDNGKTTYGPYSTSSTFTVSLLGQPNVNPFNGTVKTTTPTFSWSTVANATYYLITILDTTAHTTPYSAVKVVGTSFIPPTPLTSGDTFQFFVQAFDNSGDAGIVSQTIIVNPTSDTGTPILHAYSGAETGVTPTLSWSAASNAAAYKVYLTDSSRGTMTIYSVANALTSFTLPTPLNGGDKYTWSILAVDPAGQNESPSKTTDSFTPLTPPTALEDFDGDGKADLAVFGKDPGTGLYDIRILTSSSGFNTKVVFNNNGYGYGNAQSIPIVGDFFGDGRDSYALWTPNAQGGMTFTAVSPNSSRPSIIQNFGGTNFIPVVADLDGDGIDDFGVYGNFAGKGYAFDFLLSSDKFNPNQQEFFNNYNYSSNGVVLGFGNAQSIPIVGNFDGSGKACFALYTPSSIGSTFAVFDPSTSAGFVKTISPTMGTASDIPSAIENDPDGEADLSLYGPDPAHPGQYRYLILTASSGFNTSQALTFNNNGYGYGNATSTPVMADYDTIGTADYAVFTSDFDGGMEFVVQNSQTGAGLIEDFATQADIPLTAPSYLIARKVRGY